MNQRETQDFPCLGTVQKGVLKVTKVPNAEVNSNHFVMLKKCTLPC